MKFELIAQLVNPDSRSGRSLLDITHWFAVSRLEAFTATFQPSLSWI